ncbi:MAG: hypothetical protein JWN04_1470 [Myxococcaceae bacterium]|nr:hypothetical protein [Myxococcaceae bacterium]
MACSQRWWCVLLCALLMVACRGAPAGPSATTFLAATAADAKPAYRPAWTAGIQVHAAEIRACLRGRQPPTLVVHVQSLAVSGATGVTAIDGFGTVEHCSAEGSRVLLREPAKLQPADFAGLPAFVLGSARPAVEGGKPLEEIVDDQQVVGWLYWPSFTSESGR